MESLNLGDRIESLGKLKQPQFRAQSTGKESEHKNVILEMGKRSLWTTPLITDQHMHMEETLKMGKDLPKFEGNVAGAHKRGR